MRPWQRYGRSQNKVDRISRFSGSFPSQIKEWFINVKAEHVAPYFRPKQAFRNCIAAKVRHLERLPFNQIRIQAYDCVADGSKSMHGNRSGAFLCVVTIKSFVSPVVPVIAA